jgi:hypothetical protein
MAGVIRDWRMKMFKVFEDKVTITRSEFEEYIRMKQDREVIDRLTRGKSYLDSQDIRVAFGLPGRDEKCV